MQSGSFNLGKIHILRVDPGEDILGAVQQMIAESGMRQAVVLSGYGTMAAYHLHWVNHNRIPSEIMYQKGEGGIEILAMNGLVVEGEAHIHVALATPQGGFGGHLEPGCIAYMLCEITFGEIAGPALSRRRVPVAIENMGTGTVPRLIFEE